MYFKLAYKNVKKSYQDYFVYFITLTISVSLFYLFNSFDVQQKLLVTDNTFGISSLQSIMNVLSYLVAFVFGFLILYANNFIMRRRRKEMALYTLLGMKKSHMSRILVYETFIVGLTSLITGIGAGILLSQGAAALTARILEVSINYQFIISSKAIVFTIISFTVIFITVAFFNNIFMNRAKLIDLFKSNSTSDVITVKRPFIPTIIMIISVGFLGFLYIKIQGGLYLIQNLVFVLISGSIATFGVFYSLSYWFIKISQKMKSYYYKDLNTFSTRQISSKIKMTYKLLANVSLMLLLSFGALAVSFNIQSIMSDMFYSPGTYDYSVEVKVSPEYTNFDFDDQYEVKNTIIYNSGLATEDIIDEAVNMNIKNNPLDIWSLDISFLSLDEFNFYRNAEEKDTITLADNEIVYFAPDAIITSSKGEEILNNSFSILDVPLSVKDHDNYYTKLGSNSGFFQFIIVANENTLLQLLNNVDLSESFYDNVYLYNINFAEGQDLVIEDKKITNTVLDSYNEEEIYAYSLASRYKEYETVKQSTLLMTYLGLYIGLVFIVVSVMVLSLQLLSETSDNYERYLLLDKIGVSRKQQKKSIFRQNLTYFGLPLMVALIHSFFGITAVNKTLAAGGLKTESTSMIFVAVGILLSIYILYFLITYLSSVRMIFERKSK